MGCSIQLKGGCCLLHKTPLNMEVRRFWLKYIDRGEREGTRMECGAYHTRLMVVSSSGVKSLWFAKPGDQEGESAATSAADTYWYMC